MVSDGDQDGPRAAGLGVLLSVVALIAAVLVAQRIPRAQRPTLVQPQYTTVTSTRPPPVTP